MQKKQWLRLIAHWTVFATGLSLGLVLMSMLFGTGDIWWLTAGSQEALMDFPKSVSELPYSMDWVSSVGDSKFTWVNQEWLSGWLFSRAMAHGPIILATIHCLAFVCMMLLCTHDGTSISGNTYAHGWLPDLFFLYMCLANAFWFNFRVQTLDMFFVLAILLMCNRVMVAYEERSRTGDGVPFSLWEVRLAVTIPLIELLWVNMHMGSHVLLFVTLTVFVFGLLLEGGMQLLRGHARWLCVAFGGAVALSFLNPFTYQAWTYPLEGMSDAVMMQFVSEWHSPDFKDPVNLFAVLLPFMYMNIAFLLEWTHGKRKHDGVKDGVSYAEPLRANELFFSRVRMWEWLFAWVMFVMALRNERFCTWVCMLSLYVGYRYSDTLQDAISHLFRGDDAWMRLVHATDVESRGIKFAKRQEAADMVEQEAVRYHTIKKAKMNARIIFAALMIVVVLPTLVLASINVNNTLHPAMQEVNPDYFCTENALVYEAERVIVWNGFETLTGNPCRLYNDYDIGGWLAYNNIPALWTQTYHPYMKMSHASDLMVLAGSYVDGSHAGAGMVAEFAEAWDFDMAVLSPANAALHEWFSNNEAYILMYDGQVWDLFVKSDLMPPEEWEVGDPMDGGVGADRNTTAVT